METTQSLLAGLTVETPQNTQEMSKYLETLRKLLASCENLPPQSAEIFVIGASHDIIRKARNGTEFPFMDPEFLKIVKAMIVNMPNEAIIAFAHIFPENIQNLLQPRTENEHKSNKIKNAIYSAKEKVESEKGTENSSIDSQNLDQHPFIEKIVEKFTIRTLLNIFNITSFEDEQKDRDALSPYFFLLQEALYCYDPSTKSMSKSDNFHIICRIRAFIVFYYRMGIPIEKALELYSKIDSNDIGQTAQYVSTIHLGNFICGVYSIMHILEYPIDYELLASMYDVAQNEGAYCLPLTMEPLLIPAALPYPVLIPAAQIIKSSNLIDVDQNFGDYSIMTHENKINIDTGEGRLSV